jgi:alkyl hydroperoxide reductase subunit AhpC
MSRIKLGDIAPDFTAQSTEGRINFHHWLGDSWGILFSHPADFTPVCTTELGLLAKYKEAFHKRDVKIIALSVDSLESHKGWVKDINSTQNVEVDFPIIADENKKIAELYDMIHPNVNDKLTVRSVFIIGPDKKIKLIITYPASTGRNFDELLRVIDSLQLTTYYKVATPANWNYGEDCVILPSVTDKQINHLFPKGHIELKSYLRLTPQPNI